MKQRDDNRPTHGDALKPTPFGTLGLPAQFGADTSSSENFVDESNEPFNRTNPKQAAHPN